MRLGGLKTSPRCRTCGCSPLPGTPGTAVEFSWNSLSVTARWEHTKVLSNLPSHKSHLASERGKLCKESDCISMWVIQLQGQLIVVSDTRASPKFTLHYKEQGQALVLISPRYFSDFDMAWFLKWSDSAEPETMRPDTGLPLNFCLSLGHDLVKSDFEIISSVNEN